MKAFACKMLRSVQRNAHYIFDLRLTYPPEKIVHPYCDNGLWGWRPGLKSSVAGLA